MSTLYDPTDWVTGVTPISEANLDKMETGIRAGMPVGAMIIWPDSTPPTGFLTCDGANVLRATFVELWDFVNTNGLAGAGLPYGVGDGSTTFDLPDLQSRVIQGVPISGTAGTTGGSATHTHTNPSTSSTGSHTHSNVTTSTAATHTHSNPTTSSTGAHNHTTPNTSSAGNHTHTMGTHTHTMGTHSHFVSDTTSGPSTTTGFTTGGFFGASQTHTHATSDTSSSVDPGDTNSRDPGDTSNTGAHTHTMGNTGTNSNHSHTQGNTGSGGGHSHTQGNTGSGGTHSHTVGSSGSTSNLQPFMDLYYIVAT